MKMYSRQEFIRGFSLLGKELERLSGLFCRGENNPEGISESPVSEYDRDFLSSCHKAYSSNPFFTPYMQSVAIKRIAEDYLTEKALERLLKYSDGPVFERDGVCRNHLEQEFLIGTDSLREKMSSKTVGIIMAGNIPAVGFHGLLSTLSVGARARVKLSSKDRYLIPAIVKVLKGISTQLSERVSFEPEDGNSLSGISEEESHSGNFSGKEGKKWPFFRDGKIDFILFSGSDQVKALLGDEFPGVPILARGSRFSLGVLSGRETDSDLEALSEDMFLYCGMGCRSISYLFIPQGFDIKRIINAAQKMRPYLEEIIPFHNSYIRQRAIASLSENLVQAGSGFCDEADYAGRFFIDAGFFLLEKSANPLPPSGVVRFSFYKSEDEVDSFCSVYRDKIQKKYTNFGIAQAPATDDWMDGINTPLAILKGCLGK